jgi:hypothetical protein
MPDNEKQVALQFIPIYEYVVDENTNEIKPSPGTHPPDMGSDSICYTPQGIRYKQILTENGDIFYQYIQPDNNYANAGEAIKLPDGQIYHDNKGQVLYQQDFSSVKFDPDKSYDIDELICEYEYSNENQA